MAINQETTRTVRMDAVDLSIRDKIVDTDGQLIGLVDTVPSVDHGSSLVTFLLFTTDRGHVTTQHPVDWVVLVELERRASAW